MALVTEQPSCAGGESVRGAWPRLGHAFTSSAQKRGTASETSIAIGEGNALSRGAFKIINPMF